MQWFLKQPRQKRSIKITKLLLVFFMGGHMASVITNNCCHMSSLGIYLKEKHRLPFHTSLLPSSASKCRRPLLDSLRLYYPHCLTTIIALRLVVTIWLRSLLVATATLFGSTVVVSAIVIGFIFLHFRILLPRLFFFHNCCYRPNFIFFGLVL